MLQMWFIVITLLSSLNLVIGNYRVSISTVLLIIIGSIMIFKKPCFSFFSGKVLLALFIYMLFSGFTAIIGPCTDTFTKMVFSAPLFIFLIFIAMEIGWNANEHEWLQLQKPATWLLAICIASFMIEMIFPDYFPSQAKYRDEGRYSGLLFSEPSHVALSMFPCIVVLMTTKVKHSQRNGILALFLLFLFSYSSTLIILTTCWLLYTLLMQKQTGQQTRVAIIISFCFLIVAVASFGQYFTQTVERAVGIMDITSTANISSMIYWQGWQDAWSNLLRTHGIGLGFNMMGCNPLPDSPIRDIFDKYMPVWATYLNIHDGSFLASKIVSELGIIGISFFILVIWWWLKFERCISKNNSLGMNNFALPVQAGLMFYFIIISFTRSTSYFQGTLLIWVLAATGAAKWYYVQNRKRHHGFQPPTSPDQI